jgi:hypothetical protein
VKMPEVLLKFTPSILYVNPAPVGAVIVMVPFAIVHEGWVVTLAVGATGIGKGAVDTAVLAGLTQPLMVCVTVNDPGALTVRGLPVPASLQVRVPVNPLAVILELPQVSVTNSCGAGGIGLIITVTELLVAFGVVAQAALLVITTHTISPLVNDEDVNVDPD